MKEIKEMNKKELREEIEMIEQLIDHLSYGMKDLMYREALYNEVERRGLEVQGIKKIKLVS